MSTCTARAACKIFGNLSSFIASLSTTSTSSCTQTHPKRQFVERIEMGGHEPLTELQYHPGRTPFHTRHLCHIQNSNTVSSGWPPAMNTKQCSAALHTYQSKSEMKEPFSGTGILSMPRCCVCSSACAHLPSSKKCNWSRADCHSQSIISKAVISEVNAIQLCMSHVRSVTLEPPRSYFFE